MLYKKIKKYLANQSIYIDDVKTFFELRDTSNGEGPFIHIWDTVKISASKPSKEQLDSISDKSILLEDAINKKLQELDIYHSGSSDVRIMTINEYFILSLSSEGRNLIAEQIQQLNQKISKGLLTEETALLNIFIMAVLLK